MQEFQMIYLVNKNTQLLVIRVTNYTNHKKSIINQAIVNNWRIF